MLPSREVQDQSTANLTLDAAAAVLELAADAEQQPEAGSLPMACSDSLVKTSEISTSSSAARVRPKIRTALKAVEQMQSPAVLSIDYRVIRHLWILFTI